MDRNRVQAVETSVGTCELWKWGSAWCYEIAGKSGEAPTKGQALVAALRRAGARLNYRKVAPVHVFVGKDGQERAVAIT